MGRRGIAAAAFLHSATVNTTMSLAEKRLLFPAHQFRLILHFGIFFLV
jgi:hypothetical protein